MRHPTTALLIVEVSDTTLDYDQTEKVALYAKHMLPEYWIIDLNARRVEIFRKPFRTGGKDPQYEDIKTCGEEETIHPMAAPDAAVKVADLLP